MPKVKLSNGQVLNFPDSMSKEQMHAAIQKKFGTPKQQESSLLGSIGSGALRLGKNIGIGVSELGRNLANTPHNLANLIGQGDNVANLVDPEFDYAKAFGMDEEPTLTDKLTRGISQYAPAFALPGVGLGRAGAAVGSLGRGGKFLQGALEQAVPQAAFGATQDENPLRGAAEGGIGSVAGSALGAGLEKGFNALRPSKMLRGELTPAQLKKNLKVTKGTETGLGQVIQSPSLNRMYETILPHVLGSGAEKTMQRNTAQIINKGEGIIKKLQGKTNPEDYGIQIQDALKQASQEARAAKNANYDKLNTLADNYKLKVGRDKFQETAKKVLNDVNQSKELKNEFGKGLYNDLLRYANSSEGNNLKRTNIFRGKLGDKENELYQAGKMHEYGIVKDLKKSLSDDIESAFESSGSKELKDAYQKSQKEYKENFAPFEDKDIVKFTRQGGDPDLILNHFLRIGSGDRSSLLRKLSGKLTTNKTTPNQNLLSSAYLSRAINEEGELNPLKFKTLYNKLGQKQRKELFGDGKLHNDIKDYVDLVGKNTDSFNLMFNPKTGARTTPFLAQMGAVVSAPSYLKTIMLGAAAGKGATKALTSEKFREKLVNEMIKGKDKKLPKSAKKALEKGTAMTAGLSGKDKEQQPMELLLTKGRK